MHVGTPISKYKSCHKVPIVSLSGSLHLQTSQLLYSIIMVGKKVLLLAAALFTESVLGNPSSFLQGPITRKSDAVAALTTDSKKAAGKPQPRVVPGAYIVQLEAKGSLTKRAADLHNEFHLLARQDAGLDYSVERHSPRTLYLLAYR